MAEPMVDNRDYLVTETTLDPKLPAEKVVEFLRGRKTTGQLTFDLSQGGIQRVRVVERTRAKNDSQRDKMREALGVK